MNKKFIRYIIFIILINIAFLNYSYGTETVQCKYTNKIKNCFTANKLFSSGGSISGGELPLSIKDSLCIQSNNKEEITYQIILDDKFKKVDNDIEKYLKDLEDQKGRYFGSNKEESPLLGYDDIYNKFDIFGEYWNRYYDFCYVGNSNSIMQESMKCLKNKSSINQAKGFFSRSTCMNLATSKLAIYRKVASDIMKLNKHEARKDDRRRHTKDQKNKYDKIIDLFRINMGYLERIWSKLIEKTKKVYGG